MANSQETNVNLKINRVPDKATLENMIANNQIQPNQLYMLPSELGSGVVTMQTKVLWTNSSPTSAFVAQTITVEDMSPYDYCMLIYKNRIDNTYVGNDIHLFQANINGLVDIESTVQGTIPTCRYLIINSMTSITIEPNYNSNGQQINDYAIPLKIIGIKLIESPTQITNKYSTEETVVGEWIDGKKIYRKVVPVPGSYRIGKGSDGNLSVTQSDLPTNVSRYINGICMTYDADSGITVGTFGTVLVKNVNYSNATIGVFNAGVGNEIHIGANTTYIILEYIKTT